MHAGVLVGPGRERRLALGFHQKYPNLCSEDEQRSYGFRTTWGWVFNDTIFIFGWTMPLNISFHQSWSKRRLLFRKLNSWKCQMFDTVYVTLDHKTSLRSLGYICINSQKYIVWVKIIDFSLMPKIIRTLSKDHVSWRYFVNVLL